MRLQCIKDNQKNMRSEIFKGIRDSVSRGDLKGTSMGKRIILPTSFTDGPRYVFQNYQDAMAICRYYGYPDLFIIFTYNAKWLEIQEALSLILGQKPEDIPDIVSRVFRIKLRYFMNELTKKNHFGHVTVG